MSADIYCDKREGEKERERKRLAGRIGRVRARESLRETIVYRRRERFFAYTHTLLLSRKWRVTGHKPRRGL